ncbi:hypothetical protein VZT92_015742 [Zoarces viviparus]|uniref:AIG1-type G domain-containing protein n=1 Tax=Zoarces viviparus TaxID=48416 RepID=A0AAW1F0E7_ZOAVI
MIHEGSPTVYQLRPKKENIGTLTRMTFGEKDLSKINKTILLVGETGAGKSTLINALVNFTMGVKQEDDVWFQIVEEEKKEQSESQTSDVIVYEIFGFEDGTQPFSLSIIDTPGYGDAEGTERDVIVSQRLLDLFRSDDGVHAINAVGLVMKASENRLNDRLRYIFSSVMSLFGKNMEKNIVALITHSDGMTPKNVLGALEDAKIKCARDEDNEPVHFMFNNRQTKLKTKKNANAKGAWDSTMDQMGQFVEFLKKAEPRNLITTEVLNLHIQITACAQNLQERIELTELKEREIKQTEEALKQHKEDVKNNEKFTVEVDESYKEKEDVSERRWYYLWRNYGGAVTCNVCQENCHVSCTLAWYAEHCEVMKDGRCTVCSGKCPASDHVKEKKKYVNKTKRVTKTVAEMKEKYEKGKAGGEKSTSLLENLKREKEKLQREKEKLLEESFQHVVKLEQIALNVNALSTYDLVAFLLEKMEERGDTEKVQKLKEMKRRMDEDKGTKSVLKYMRGGLAAFGRPDVTAEATIRSLRHQHLFQPHGVQPSLPDITMATQITNASSKYKDFISKSIMIHEGSPTVYQLRPKKENIGNLTRMTFGEKDLNKINKTILLVGETGAGKSTLINALVNFTMGVKQEDDVWFQIVEEEKKKQSESQTSDVIVYEIFGFEDGTQPFSLSIIDTPGYGDAEGTERDVIVGQRLLDLFRLDDGVHAINAVGLVMKASENRLNDRLRYIFSSVMSLFGKNMEKNIVALITHSDGVTPKNVLDALEDANIKCARDEDNEPVHFMFNNHQTKLKTKKNKFALKGAWDLTMDQMGQFVEFLKKAEPRNLITTTEVLNLHIQITACAQNLQERIELTELKEREIKQTEEALKQHKEDVKNNEKFTVEVDESYKEKEDVSERRWYYLWLNYGGAVTCNVCQENCHVSCTLAWYAEQCVVMKDGSCTVCSGKCPASDHVKEKKKYVTKTKRVTKTVAEMKEKYEKGKAGGEKFTSLLENLKREKEKLQRGKEKLLEESFQHVVKLEQIALNVNALSTYDLVAFLLEKMEERGDTEKVQKLKEMKRRMDEDKGTKSVLKYMRGGLAAFGRPGKKSMK